MPGRYLARDAQLCEKFIDIASMIRDLHLHFSADYTLYIHEFFVDYLQPSFPHSDFQTFPPQSSIQSVASAFFFTSILGWSCGLHRKSKIGCRYIQAV
jgi:hypothetical protein